jgi:hypothetical protein
MNDTSPVHSLRRQPTVKDLLDHWDRRFEELQEKLAVDNDNTPPSNIEQEILSDNEGRYPELGGPVCIVGEW